MDLTMTSLSTKDLIFLQGLLSGLHLAISELIVTSVIRDNADAIYPSHSTFVSTISNPGGNKRAHFAAAHESATKDVVRTFGVLQARFAIIHRPATY